jgi:hypothetical protein
MGFNTSMAHLILPSPAPLFIRFIFLAALHLFHYNFWLLGSSYSLLQPKLSKPAWNQRRGVDQSAISMKEVADQPSLPFKDQDKHHTTSQIFISLRSPLIWIRSTLLVPMRCRRATRIACPGSSPMRSTPRSHHETNPGNYLIRAGSLFVGRAICPLSYCSGMVKGSTSGESFVYIFFSGLLIGVLRLEIPC